MHAIKRAIIFLQQLLKFLIFTKIFKNDLNRSGAMIKNNCFLIFKRVNLLVVVTYYVINGKSLMKRLVQVCILICFLICIIENSPIQVFKKPID